MDEHIVAFESEEFIKETYARSRTWDEYWNDFVEYSLGVKTQWYNDESDRVGIVCGPQDFILLILDVETGDYLIELDFNSSIPLDYDDSDFDKPVDYVALYVQPNSERQKLTTFHNLYLKLRDIVRNLYNEYNAK